MAIRFPYGLSWYNQGLLGKQDQQFNNWSKSVL